MSNSNLNTKINNKERIKSIYNYTDKEYELYNIVKNNLNTDKGYEAYYNLYKLIYDNTKNKDINERRKIITHKIINLSMDFDWDNKLSNAFDKLAIKDNRQDLLVW